MMQRLITSPMSPGNLNVSKMKPRQKYQISASLLLILCLGIVYFHDRTIRDLLKVTASSAKDAAEAEESEEGKGEVPFDGIMNSEWCKGKKIFLIVCQMSYSCFRIMNDMLLIISCFVSLHVSISVHSPSS